MCENWGYLRLGACYRKESIEELVHAEKLMNRILFLDRTPNMTDLRPTTPRALFEEILKDEEEHVDYLEGQLHALGERVAAIPAAQRT